MWVSTTHIDSDVDEEDEIEGDEVEEEEEVRDAKKHTDTSEDGISPLPSQPTNAADAVSRVYAHRIIRSGS